MQFLILFIFPISHPQFAHQIVHWPLVQVKKKPSKGGYFGLSHNQLQLQLHMHLFYWPSFCLGSLQGLGHLLYPAPFLFSGQRVRETWSVKEERVITALSGVLLKSA